MTKPRLNPYPGPSPFERGQTLYGRDREQLDLRDLLIAERIVLLYSPSGAGKTSLIQAALIPALEDEKFRVLPIMRVNRTSLEVASQVNRYVLSSLLSLEDAPSPEPRHSLSHPGDLSFADYLAQGNELAKDGRRTVLIFDQFEEILTVDPTDGPVKAEFFEQLGRVLQDERRWGLFAMREEFIAGLEPYQHLVPTRFCTTFRLDLLDKEAAMDAIRKPVETAKVTFNFKAAETLVDDLRTVQVQQPDGKQVSALGPYVEPVQLQVVCRHLWDGLSSDDMQIDEADISEVGDVDTALGAYYAAKVKAIAETTGVSERAIRDWMEQQLITESGYRGQAMQGEGASQGLDNQAIWLLVDAHLVREDRRRGVTWFELAHDRLVRPVRDSNEIWRQKKLSTLQLKAALWIKGGQPDGLLLKGEELVEAIAWADTHDLELVEYESKFLAESQKTELEDAQKYRQQERIRRLAIGATITSVLAIIGVVALVILAIQFRLQARIADEIRSSGLAAQSQVHLDDQYDLALLLALEAKQAADTVEARGSLLSALEHNPQLTEFVRDPSHQVSSVAFSPDGKLLATVGSRTVTTGTTRTTSGTVTLWDTSGDLARFLTSLGELSSPAVVAAFSPDGKTLAVGNEDATVYLWDLRNEPPSKRTWTAHNDRVNSLSFSPNGRWLASAGKTEVILWDLTAPETPAPTRLPDDGPVRSVAFGPDSRTLAVGYADGRISLWDTITRQALELEGQKDDVQTNSLAFSPDGQKLAAARSDNLVVLFDLSTRHPAPLTGHEGGVESVAFSSDGKLLASGSRDKTIRLWDVATAQPQGPALSGHTGWVMAVALRPGSRSLASGSFDGNVILWDTTARSRLGRRLTGIHSDEVRAVAVSPDGRRLASGGKDGRVVLWDTASGQPVGVGRHNTLVGTVSFSSDGATLASGGGDGYIILWDVSARRPAEKARLIHSKGAFVSSIAFSPDGQFLASGSFDNTVKLWDLRSSSFYSRTLAGHTGLVLSLVFSKDGRKLASSDAEGKIIIWNVGNGEAQGQRVLAGAQAIAIRSIDFSPDGRWLASGDSDGQVILWDVGARQQIARLVRHTGSVTGVAFSSDGRMLASSSLDGTVILWDMDTKRLIGEPLRGHDRPVNGLAFSKSRDVPLIADASDDLSIMVWNLDFQNWRTPACRVANRDLTDQEWQDYLGTRSYQSTCSELTTR